MSHRIARSISVSALALAFAFSSGGARAQVVGTNLVADMVQKTSPTVVNISSEQNVRGYADPRMRVLGDLFGGHQEVFPRHGEGSGFILDEKGHILTNDHVVSDASKIQVTLSDGRQFSAKMVGSSPDHDVAVILLDLEGQTLRADQIARLGDSDKIRAGEWVSAIGSPFALQNTVTVGIISALGRNLNIQGRVYKNLIQTDTSINPGNSGGPLMDMEGKVIGVNTAINPNAQGIGFALPINLAQKIAKDIIETGEFKETFLGVATEPVTQQIARENGLESVSGIVVRGVVEGSPAAKAGVAEGDLILKYQGQPILTVFHLKEKVEETTAGTAIELDVVRDGKALKIPVTIEAHQGELDRMAATMGRTPGNLRIRPPASAPGEEPDSKPAPKSADAPFQLGVTVRSLTPEDRKAAELDEDVAGVIVNDVTPGTPASGLGISPGDVIVWANGKSITTPEELAQAVKQEDDRAGQRSIALKILRGGGYLMVSASF